jgi:ABC-type uncharacterized transport system permease subunit
MPPLQTMEYLLFRLIWTGEVLLALAILTGALFLENMFAQHLAHKTVLSIVAWLVFAVLLWGKHRLGWRGTTAVKWTLTGFGLLILAYLRQQVRARTAAAASGLTEPPANRVAMPRGFLQHTGPV